MGEGALCVTFDAGLRSTPEVQNEREDPGRYLTDQRADQLEDLGNALLDNIELKHPRPWSSRSCKHDVSAPTLRPSSFLPYLAPKAASRASGHRRVCFGRKHRQSWGSFRNGMRGGGNILSAAVLERPSSECQRDFVFESAYLDLFGRPKMAPNLSDFVRIPP